MASTNKIVKKIATSIGRIIPDKIYINLRYKRAFNARVNWKKPQSFNEKLQWMKVYDRNPMYTKLVDKYEVKEYVSSVLGKKYVIPTIGVYDNFEDIDFNLLPEQFVMKCTHDSGSVKMCQSKRDFNIHEVRKHFNERMKKNLYYGGREWAYKNVKPRIIIEPLLVDEDQQGIKDYKFFCFDGEVKALFVATDRGVPNTDVKFDFFDSQYNHLPIKNGHENAEVTPAKPEGFEDMIKVARKLSKGFRQVRIDLYYVNSSILFGEMTFYHHCGFVPFEPQEWDNKFGEWINLEK